jgi:hypothetical protein
MKRHARALVRIEIIDSNRHRNERAGARGRRPLSKQVLPPRARRPATDFDPNQPSAEFLAYSALIDCTVQLGMLPTAPVEATVTPFMNHIGVATGITPEKIAHPVAVVFGRRQASP